MRVLDARNVHVREELVVTTHSGQGYSMVLRGGTLVCDDSPDTHSRIAKLALAAAPLKGKSVAWIGGGLCVGPRLFAIADCVQTVYEIEPRLVEFCPSDVRFVTGDWRDSISGKFDVIVYDLGGDVPHDLLAKFLNSGGKVIPCET